MPINNLYNSSPLVPGEDCDNGWNAFARIAFRVFFIYFILQAVPLDWKFYRGLFAINWVHLSFTDIFSIAHYIPVFGDDQPSYRTWGILFILSLLGGGVWTWADKNRKAGYDGLYYLVRAIVRYRLSIAVIAYGFIKLFPIQAPYPSISNLNTHYGDFTRWKIFSLSLGIVPGYESFLGIVEIIAGLLLLYRRTASIGAFIIIIFTGNVFVSNLAYEGGEQVYSLYLISLAVFVLVFDLRRLADLLVFQRPAVPTHFRPRFIHAWSRNARLLLKAAFISFFVLLYGVKTGSAFHKGNVRFPDQKGLTGAAGIYNVRSFRVNKDSLGYSLNDNVRWQDVVFEKWNTVSIRSSRPVIIDSNNVERFTNGPEAKNYELEGSAERHYYSYTADTVHHTLTLKNKNRHYQDETLVFQYQQASDSSLVLAGINERKDSLFITLDRIKRRYLLEEAAGRGRQKPIKL